MTDYWMPKINGIQLFKYVMLSENNRNAVRILIMEIQMQM